MPFHTYTKVKNLFFFFLSLSLNMLVYTNSLVPVLLVFISSVQRYPRVFTTSWSSCQRSARHTSFCRSIGPFFFFHISELLRKTTLFLLLLKTRYWKLLGKKKHMYIYLKTKKEIEKSIHLEIFFFRVENWGIKIVALNSAVLNSLKTDKDEIITIKFVQDTVSSLVSVNASRFLGKASLFGRTGSLKQRERKPARAENVNNAGKHF